MGFKEEVYFYCKKIPRGKVSTYGAIASAMGKDGAVRAVGGALNKNPYKEVPCHRVVGFDGSLVGFASGVKEKERILKSEGVEVVNGKVDLERYGVELK
tara:strand:- start:761 stop:1057 length:297 start_codon:yes stop_codon:yes gene_type:complete